MRSNPPIKHLTDMVKELSDLIYYIVSNDEIYCQIVADILKTKLIKTHEILNVLSSLEVKHEGKVKENSDGLDRLRNL